MKYLFIKHLSSLKPADQSAADAFKVLSQGESVLIIFDKGRNPQHHKKFFAVLNLVFDTLPEGSFKNADHLRHVCLCEIGHCDMIDRDGATYTIPHSMKFEDMGQVTFNDLYEKAMVWFSDLIGVDVETLRSEL